MKCMTRLMPQVKIENVWSNYRKESQEYIKDAKDILNKAVYSQHDAKKEIERIAVIIKNGCNECGNNSHSIPLIGKQPAERGQDALETAIYTTNCTK